MGGGGGHEEEDDGSFTGYIIKSVDLGPGLFLGALLAFFFSYGVVLPVLVYLGNRRETRRRISDKTEFFSASEDSSQDLPRPNTNSKQLHDVDKSSGKKSPTTQQLAAGNTTTTQIHTNNDEYHDARITTATSNNQHEEEVCSVASSSRHSSRSTTSTHSSALGSAVAAILDHPPHLKSKGTRKRRRVREKEMLKAQLTAGQSTAFSPTNGGGPETLALLQGIHPGAIPAEPDYLPSPITPRPSTSPTPFEESACQSPSAKNSPSPRTTTTTPTKKYAEDYPTMGVLDKVALISAYDIETRRIIRLATPFCTQALITGLTDILTVAVVGKLIGTREVSAFVIVGMWVELSSEFVGGLHEALATLCSQAIGARNKELAGSYVQIVVILYTLFFIPFAILWVCYMDAILRWHGLDEETVHIGMQYTYILVVDALIDGFGESVHGLLDVAGFEKYSTLIGATEEILSLVIILIWALVGNPDLNTVGLVQFGLGVIFLTLNCVLIHFRGWFKAYYKGMFGSFGLFNGKSVWLVCKTASSLAFGMLLTDGEWEILTICAQVLGPAEVVAWGILGTIWQGSHELIDAIADASEVRCAFLLGSGQPDRANVSAYKSMMIGTFAALFLTSLIYMAGEDLPIWFTSDPALQHILREIIPMFGLANFVMALDTMSWTLIGSQGRYQLATLIVCLSSWFVTIPLAVAFSVAWNVNLEGQMAGFTIGYLVMGVAHSYFLLRSNWHALSEQVMEDHEANHAPATPAAPAATPTSLAAAEVPTNSEKHSTSSESQPHDVSPSPSIISAGSLGSGIMPMELAS